MITIIDYGMGNLHSVARGLEKAGGTVKVSAEAADLDAAEGIILPGVGAFEKGIRNLEKLDILPLLKARIAAGVPFLGICLGMQMLFTESDENGLHQGLDLVPGRVIRFEGDMKIPQMGWNQVALQKDTPLYQGVPDNSYFYFVHSYYCVPADPTDTLGATDYGVTFASAVARDNVYGTQFHPEKSQTLGIKMLTNFVKMTKGAK